MENNIFATNEDLDFNVWRDLFKDAAGFRPSPVWNDFFNDLPDRDQEVLWDAVQALSDKRSLEKELEECSAFDHWTDRIEKLMNEPCWINGRQKTAFHEAVIKALNADNVKVFGDYGFEHQEFDHWLFNSGISVTKFDEIRNQFIYHILTDPRWAEWRKTNSLS
jgi:hypothetical protein